MPPDPRHDEWMRAALAEARLAEDAGDVPVGAVVVHEGVVVATGRNRREVDADPTAHAEVLALRAASEALGRWRLDDCLLVVTLEPCAMCAGALVASRIGGLVYGATDLKAGAVHSLYGLASDPRLNHEYPVRHGVSAEECGRLLSDFFAARR